MSVPFAALPPSASWQLVPLSADPRHVLAIWIKPGNTPDRLLLRIPDESYAADPEFASRITPRAALHASGIHPATVHSWTVFGVTHEAAQGMNPQLDQPIPLPSPGSDPTVTVVMLPSVAPLPMAQPGMLMPGSAAPPLAAAAPMMQAAAPQSADANDEFAPMTGGSNEVLLKRIDMDWTACKDTQIDLTRLRKQMDDQMAKLGSLNRDLGPDERRFSSPQDKREWVEARRGLRDAMNRLSRFMKSYDIGDASAAGQKNHMLELYEYHIVQGQRHDQLLNVSNEIIGYRKLLTTLRNNMAGALSQSRQNAERRAQQILNEIRRKVREAQTKKNMLGVMLD